MIETPIKSNGYYKYVIQIGWWEPVPDLKFAVLAQDILSKSKEDASYLMKFLYPESLNIEFPFLCPVVQEIKESDLEEGIDNDVFGNTVEKIDLIYPN